MRGLALLIALPAALGAQQFEFSIKNMMRGPEVYGREPQNVRWSADGKWIYFNWLEPGSDWRLSSKPFRVRAEPGAKPERVPDAQMDSVAPTLDNGRMSPDRRLKIVASGGDLYVVDQNGGVRRLTQTFDVESNPVFSADGREVFFVRADNVYAVALDGGLVRQLTDIRPAGGAAPAPVGGGRGGRGGGGGGEGSGAMQSATTRNSSAAAARALRRHP